MIEVVNQNIKITKGDSAYITLEAKDLALADIKIQVRDAPDDGELLFEGVIVQIGEDIVWHIRPEDTETAVVRKPYVYDVMVSTENADIPAEDKYHAMWEHSFVVMPRATRPDEEEDNG